MDIFEVLRIAAKKNASDVHILASVPPMLRVHGSLEPLEDEAPLLQEEIDEALTRITTPEQREIFRRELELDFSCTVPEVGRIRCNVGRQQGTTSFAIRILPSKIPAIDEVVLPPVCKEMISRPRGLLIVSGPTGSGKSTSLAAMIQYLNATQSRHLVTIEDPVEYLYTSQKCVIAQRELSSDTLSFAEALRRVLRQDPDVILVGEMRDLETAATVLTVAETGHLVLTTGHAPSAPQALERIIDMFPPSERHLAQTRLASLLLGVLCQVLVPKADGSGRVVAVEVMLANSPVKNLIREGKIFQLPNVIRTHAQLGMITLDQSLLNLYYKGLIDRKQLLAFCNDQDEIEKLASNQGARLELSRIKKESAETSVKTDSRSF